MYYMRIAGGVWQSVLKEEIKISQAVSELKKKNKKKKTLFTDVYEMKRENCGQRETFIVEQSNAAGRKIVEMVNFR